LPPKAVVIGAGFSGLSSACFLAQKGWQVTVLEKHATAGGRARKMEAAGFSFDMGPSWYWMPDVFERFFNQFGKKVSDYYELLRLDPSYRVYWPEGSFDIPAGYEALRHLFEQTEPGAGAQLDRFLKEAIYKYQTGINKLVHKPGLSLLEFLDADVIKGVWKLDVFGNMRKHVARFFKDTRLRQLMEFPVLFLGAEAKNIPALYSLMNYADIKLGTWFPRGGMYKIIEGMQELAVSLGVQFHFSTPAEQININAGRVADSVKAGGRLFEADIVVSGADYHFTETCLLEPRYRNYSEAYWEKRVMAPSCLLYYVGLNRRLEGLPHHSLFFDTDFEQHAGEIYRTPSWPQNPLFYLSRVTATDAALAPEGCDNLFFLIPVAAGLQGDDAEIREKYFNLIAERLEKRTGCAVREHIIYNKSFSVHDFVTEYGAFKGNAYGLANTLRQTAILKPSCKNKKVRNLYYTGQLTVPGPGVPPSLISGEVVANLADKEYKNKRSTDD
jgi:phytoene desaturase